MPSATPTNHTTRAYFGGLEVESSDEDDEESCDEQSSIDCSQLIDPSMHSRLTSVMGGTYDASVNNQSNKNNNNNNNNNNNDESVNDTQVLTAILEEENTPCSEKKTVPRDPVSEPVEHPLQEQPQQPSEQEESTPTQEGLAASAPLPVLLLSRSNDEKSVISYPPSVQCSAAPSVTMHVSNADPLAYRRMEEESERNIAWAVHAVLGVFCGLILLSSVMTFLIVENYGLVTMMGSVLLLCFMIFLMYFVDQTVLSQSTKLKPMRRKVIRVLELAKKAMVEEFHLFKRDWNEHFLLTNGSPLDNDDDDENGDDIEEQRRRTESTTFPFGAARGLPARTKKRSVVFQAIKSSMRMGRRVWAGRRRKQPTKEQEPKYHPPNADNGVTVA